MEGFEARLSGYCASSRQFVLFEYVSTGVLAGIGTINLVLGPSTPEIQFLEMRPWRHDDTRSPCPSWAGPGGMILKTERKACFCR